MEFNGEFELEGVSPEEAWIVLSDPIAIRNALPGCKYLTRIDDVEDFDFDEYEPEEGVETLPEADPEDVEARAFVEGAQYAALMQVGVGSVKPTFETTVTIDSREFPRMEASGGGDASGSAFEMNAWMDIEETDTGSKVSWGTTADISGRIAQLGQRVIKPVANRLVNNFFSNIESQMKDVETEEGEESVTSRLKNLF